MAYQKLPGIYRKEDPSPSKQKAKQRKPPKIKPDAPMPVFPPRKPLPPGIPNFPHTLMPKKPKAKKRNYREYGV